MFDSMFSDDPQRQAMMMLAAGLLSPVKNRGGAGFAEAMSNGIQGGLLASNQARQNKQRNAQAEMQAKMQQAQLGQMERANADEEYKRSIAPNYFSPGNAPADGMGPVMPPKADLAGYGAALAQRSPEMGLPYMPKPQAPKMAFAPNGEAVDMNALPVGRNFAPQQEAKPDYKDYPSNGRIVRVFNDGKSKVIYNAPDGPAKPDKPIWDPTRGGFVTPPSNGQGPSFTPVPGAEKAAKTPKPGEAYMKQQAGVNNVVSALDDYINELKTFGGTDIVNPDARAKMGTVYNNALLQAKEAFNLGVLNGPDYAILQQTLTDPASARGAITSNAAMKAQAEKLQELMRKVAKGAQEAHGQGGNGASGGWGGSGGTTVSNW